MSAGLSCHVTSSNGSCECDLRGSLRSRGHGGSERERERGGVRGRACVDACVGLADDHEAGGGGGRGGMRG